MTISTRNEWDVAARPEVPTVHVKKILAKSVRKYVSKLGAGVSISTNELVEALYPNTDLYDLGSADKNPEKEKVRARLYDLLKTLAKEDLHDCCEKGEATGTYMGRPKRPWLWHAPKAFECCVMCGQRMPS